MGDPSLAGDLNRVELEILFESMSAKPAVAASLNELGVSSAADLRLLEPSDVHKVASQLKKVPAKKLIIALDLSWVDFMHNHWEEDPANAVTPAISRKSCPPRMQQDLDDGSYLAAAAAATEAQPKNPYKNVPNPLKSKREAVHPRVVN